MLLLKGAPDKRLWANQYNGIGGHVEFGEDLLTSARRELAEEAGLDVPDLWLCGTIVIDVSQDVGIGLFVYKGEYCTGELKASKEGDLEWVQRAQLNHLPLTEDLSMLLPRILNMKRGNTPFSGHYWYDDLNTLHTDIF